MASQETLNLGAKQVPYFRTPEFSEIMLENERLFLDLLHAPANARAVFITGSGTAAMESAVMNVLNTEDRALIADGGTFGHRFCDLCNVHDVPFERIELEAGNGLHEEDLSVFDGGHYTAFLVNLCETSTGVLYDLELISSFCKRNNLLLVVDAISSFLADPLDMEQAGADVVITGSQKALACPPGISAIALSPRSLDRIHENPTRCMYLDLKDALANGERGQTPFTPAVGTLLQLNARFRQIKSNGGSKSEIGRVAVLATHFRNSISSLPLEQLPEKCSNALTALRTKRGRAGEVFSILKDDYGIWICPNGGELKNSVFRVGHIGALSKMDFDKLAGALEELQTRGIV